jgi:anti-sigma B factor antagonist
MCSQRHTGWRESGSEGVLARGALTLRSEREPTAHVVSVAGELDLASAGLLEEVVGKALSGDAPMVVLDLSELRFIDSTGIHALLRLQARSSDDGNRLRMLRGSPDVQRVLELTGADRLLPFLGVEPVAIGSA